MAEDLPTGVPGVSSRFAAGLLRLWHGGLDRPTGEAARRSLVNVLGTAVGGAGHPGVEAIAATGPVFGGPPVRIPGSAAELPIFAAALAVGFAAHVDDFDDTDLQTVLHPGAAALGAGYVLAQMEKSSGEQFLTAFAVGCEAELRLARAISPSNYDRGWHITGTTGSVGAAVTAALLLGLDVRRLQDAIDLAANEVLGHRENFGTMTKPFHPGKAAANGVLAALLAREGLAGSPDLLGTPGGFLDVMAEQADLAALFPEPGAAWVLNDNSFKPYPCGIVSHPGIDAGIGLHAAFAGAPDSGVTLRCHPLVVELTGNPDPRDGLEARFSSRHGVAVGVLFGRAGLAEYDDAVVLDPRVRELRSRIRLEVDESIPRDGALALLTAPDGAVRHELRVEHARGSLARPLSDAELNEKVGRLLEPGLPGRTAEILRQAGDLHSEADFESLVALLSPAVPDESGEFHPGALDD